MHQDAAFTAIHRALMRLLPDLAETVEGRTKIANMVDGCSGCRAAPSIDWRRPP